MDKTSKNIINHNNHNFKKNPNLKYKLNITELNSLYGLEIFEIFTSLEDNEIYLASPNKVNNNLNIFDLINNKKIFSFKGHNDFISVIRYFYNNKNKLEYLMSVDKDNVAIIWEINKNYNIKYKINTKFAGGIYSCLIIFPHNSDKNLVVVCSTGPDLQIKKNAKIYNFENGKFINSIDNKSSIYYLLSWYNLKNHEYYIIQISYARIRISNFEDKVYAILKKEPEDIHYNGFIFNRNDNYYLCCSSNNGYVNIWDLYNKKIFKIIYIKSSKLMNIIPWNEKYIIVSDFGNKSLRIIDYEQNKVISNIKINNCKVKTFKKCLHPIYGESLLILTEDKIIKLCCL